jgi:adenylate kinase family enzyme
MNGTPDSCGMIDAILIIGHSNSGKSPLGEYIQEKSSVPLKRYFHFDFGSELRRVTAESGYAGLSASEQAYVHSVMNGQLLDKDHFSIAGKIIKSFMAHNGFRPACDVLVLNGFPRNVSQAGCAASFDIKIECVIYLDCPVRIAWVRKTAAEKGNGFEDRSNRPDTSVEIFNRKVASFEQETWPLVEYYRHNHIAVVTIDVRETTSPAEMYISIKPSSEKGGCV